MVNPHTNAANIDKRSYDPRFDGYHLAQATLALAYEQRTANLIEWRTSGKNRTDEGPAIDKHIRERLGLVD